MQTENQEENNVVSIFERNREASKAKSPVNPEPKATEANYDFEAIVRQNMEKKNKMQQERLKSNRGVIRSYRLKN